ncbi:MAG: hypothetical protein EOM02_02350 [Synergistales bacterium]|nr:hypothetical protein [Synergistales bacterium]
MSHKPGPWKWNKMNRVWMLMPEANLRDGLNVTGAVCEVIPLKTEGDSEAFYTGTEEQHANAALLEAAPGMKDEIDRLKAEKAELMEALEGLANVIDESEGVAGWHLNGAVAPWSEFGFAQKIEDVIEKARVAE